MSHDDKWKADFPFPGPRKFWKLADIVIHPVIYLWNPLNLLEPEKCLLDKKYKQETMWQKNMRNVLCRETQRRWAHRWLKSHPRILQCMNRHYAHEVLTFWEHKFICNQKKNTPLVKALFRHTRGTQLTYLYEGKHNTKHLFQKQLRYD